MSEINREYKDRLFVFIFGREENRKWTLSLYNAVNGTNYTDENAIEITTMSDAVYMGMRNDVSFIITEFISLFEQQSTYNPNSRRRTRAISGKRHIPMTGHRTVTLMFLLIKQTGCSLRQKSKACVTATPYSFIFM